MKWSVPGPEQSLRGDEREVGEVGETERWERV
jgi:hypothetical protein